MFTITKSTDDFATIEDTFTIQSVAIFDAIDLIGSDNITDSWFDDLGDDYPPNVIEMLSFYVCQPAYEPRMCDSFMRDGCGWIYHDCAQYKITPNEI